MGQATQHSLETVHRKKIFSFREHPFILIRLCCIQAVTFCFERCNSADHLRFAF